MTINQLLALKPGDKVLIRAAGVPIGTQGTVVEVKRNGEVVTIWGHRLMPAVWLDFGHCRQSGFHPKEVEHIS